MAKFKFQLKTFDGAVLFEFETKSRELLLKAVMTTCAHPREGSVVEIYENDVKWLHAEKQERLA